MFTGSGELLRRQLNGDAVLSIGGALNVVRVYRGRRLVWSAFAYRSRWKHLGACQGMPVETFMPEGPDDLDEPTAAALVELCSACPVRLRCGSYGRASRSIGWWGGQLLYFGEPAAKQLARQATPVTVTDAPVRRRAITHRNRGVSSLTDDDVAEIRRRYAAGDVLQTQLAAEFGVRHQAISEVVGSGMGNRNAAKTHCPKGHEYTAANTYTAPSGARSCRECARMRERTSRRSGTSPGSPRRTPEPTASPPS